MLNQEEFLQKYGEIIKEEVNVKEIWSFQSKTPIKKVFKPIGSQLSAKFGKDTGQIISNGKQGNIRELEDGKVEVFSAQWGSWILDVSDYEIAYEGLDAYDTAVEGNMIAQLDLNITPELEREGVVREFSRFLNQMRKDADFPIDAKVVMTYETSSEEMERLIAEFDVVLRGEALLKNIQKGLEKWAIESDFSSFLGDVKVSLVL